MLLQMDMALSCSLEITKYTWGPKEEDPLAEPRQACRCKQLWVL